MSDTSPHFQIVQCSQMGCRFRFPMEVGQVRGLACPRCGQMLVLVGAVATSAEDFPASRHVEPIIEALLDNIRSIHNVGSMFRTADGAGISHLYLGGITATPDHPKLAKAALGAQGSVAWSQHNNGLETAVDLKDQGYQLWAVEAGSQSVPLFEAEVSFIEQPVLLIVGNEKAGVDPGILDVCHRIFSLPMGGYKHSLNVAVAFGITSYYLRYGLV